MRSLDGVALRQLGTRRLRTGLTATAVALGVGMLFGVLLLSGSIRGTFDDLIDQAWGSVDLIVSGQGGIGVIADEDVRRMAATPGIAEAAPMVGGALQRLDDRGRALTGITGRMTIAGFDPARGVPFDFDRVAGRPVRSGLEVEVERNWAQGLDLRVGDTVPVATATGRRRLRIVGAFQLAGGLDFGGSGYAVMPERAARELFAVPSGWHQVELRAADGTDVPALQDRLERLLGPGLEVRTPQSFGDQLTDQLRTLDVVLLLFGGTALFVGGFLILNAFQMTVLQRMRELGTLRTLGASRRAVGRTVLVEALAVGAVGTIAGLLVGFGFAQGLLALLQDQGMPVGTVRVGLGSVVAASLLGVLATLAGAAWPARRAAKVPPIRATLGQLPADRRPARRRLVWAIVLFLPGAVFGGQFWFGGSSSTSALMSAFGLVATLAMLAGMVAGAPWVITPLVRLLARPLARLLPAGGRLAGDALAQNPLRTAATAAALAVGLSVIVVNATMAQSFIGTIEDQLTASMARDLTVRPAGSTLADGGLQTVPPSLERQVRALPGVRTTSSVRATMADLPGRSSAAQVGLVQGVDPATYGLVDRSAVTGASRDDALAALGRGGAIVNRSYADAAGLAVGEVVELHGSQGTRRVRVAAVLDQLNEVPLDLIQVSNGTMTAVWGPGDPAELAVTTTPGTTDEVRSQVQRLLDRDQPGLEVVSAAEHRQATSDRIEQNFALFNAIVAVAIVISLLGVVNTLAMSVLERTRELGVLRALGASRRLLRTTVVAESALVTQAGALAGLGVGLALAWWWSRSLDGVMPGFTLHLPWATALLVAAGAVLLGALAAALPARRAARLQVVQALTAD